MAVDNVEIIPSKYAENSQTTQYTVATGESVIIDSFTATNIGASSATLSVNIVPSGGTAGNDNLIIDAKSIGVNKTYTFPELVGKRMVAGTFLSLIASAASTLTVNASGRVVS